MEDYGYGDPGYSDPSYEGPRTGPAFGGQAGNATAPGPLGESGYRSADTEVPGYHVPGIRESSRPGYGGPGYQPQDLAPPSGGQEIWPVTGAQEALPDTGPQPVAEARGARGSVRRVARPTRSSGTAVRGSTARPPPRHVPATLGLRA